MKPLRTKTSLRWTTVWKTRLTSDWLIICGFNNNDLAPGQLLIKSQQWRRKGASGGFLGLAGGAGGPQAGPSDGEDGVAHGKNSEDREGSVVAGLRLAEWAFFFCQELGHVGRLIKAATLIY